jgi:hypothetical protein
MTSIQQAGGAGASGCGSCPPRPRRGSSPIGDDSDRGARPVGTTSGRRVRLPPALAISREGRDDRGRSHPRAAPHPLDTTHDLGPRNRCGPHHPPAPAGGGVTVPEGVWNIPSLGAGRTPPAGLRKAVP